MDGPVLAPVACLRVEEDELDLDTEHDEPVQDCWTPERVVLAGSPVLDVLQVQSASTAVQLLGKAVAEAGSSIQLEVVALVVLQT